MFIQNSEYINKVYSCDYCSRKFEKFIPHSHLKPCRFSLWISKYYKSQKNSEILDALDEGFIETVNNSIINCGGEQGWEIYEKIMKNYIEIFLPFQLSNKIISQGLQSCYKFINQ